MEFKISGADMEKLYHCSFKGEAKRLSKERGAGGIVVAVFTNLHYTYLMGSFEDGFLGFDGEKHLFKIDPESKYNRRQSIIRA